MVKVLKCLLMLCAIGLTSSQALFADDAGKAVPPNVVHIKGDPKMHTFSYDITLAKGWHVAAKQDGGDFGTDINLDGSDDETLEVSCITDTLHQFSPAFFSIDKTAMKSHPEQYKLIEFDGWKGQMHAVALPARTGEKAFCGIMASLKRGDSIILFHITIYGRDVSLSYYQSLERMLRSIRATTVPK